MDVYRITLKGFTIKDERLNGQTARMLMDSRKLTDMTAFLKAFDAACTASGVTNPWGFDLPNMPIHGIGYTMDRDSKTKTYVPYTAAFFFAVLCSREVARLIGRMPEVGSVIRTGPARLL